MYILICRKRSREMSLLLFIVKHPKNPESLSLSRNLYFVKWNVMMIQKQEIYKIKVGLGFGKEAK